MLVCVYECDLPIHLGNLVQVVMLTALLEKMQSAREDFEILDEQIEEIDTQLEKIQAARLSTEEHMRRIRKEEEHMVLIYPYLLVKEPLYFVCWL